MEEINISEEKQSKKPNFLLRPFSRTTKIVLLILLIIFGLVFAWAIYVTPIADSFNPFASRKGDQGELPTLNAVCPLNGSAAADDMVGNRPFGVMIENHPDARPQSGLDKADLVYEVVTEGGITRFLAFFGCQNPSQIGPVRSSRIYYLDWVSELKSFYAHAGGSPDSLAAIQQRGIFDLNHATGYFWRSTSRAAPHNLYTSLEKLKSYAQSRHYDLNKADFTLWKFKDDPEKSARPESKSVKINFSSASFLVSYSYNKETNNWSRSMAGKSHLDAATGKQLKVKNIVVQYSQIVARSDGRGDVGNIGSGQALFFIDGIALTGTWKKDSTSARTIYADSNGREIEFSRGPIWIEVVKLGTVINY